MTYDAGKMTHDGAKATYDENKDEAERILGFCIIPRTIHEIKVYYDKIKGTEDAKEG